MSDTWYLLPNGSYKRLSAAEDVLSEVGPTVEDVAETMRILRDVCQQACQASLESQRVAQSRQDRRLRKPMLRLVRRHG